MKKYAKTRKWISVQRPAAEEMKTHGRHRQAPLSAGAGRRGPQREGKVQDRGIINSVKCWKREDSRLTAEKSLDLPKRRGTGGLAGGSCSER